VVDRNIIIDGEDNFRPSGFADAKNWTPTMHSGTSLSINGAKYYKIGPLVFAWCYITNLNYPNNGSQFRIGGLPYQSYNYFTGTIGYSGTGNTSSVHPITVPTSGKYIYFHRTDGPSLSLTNANFTSRNVVTMLLQVVYLTQE